VKKHNQNRIRKCASSDFDAIWEVINDGARAYKGIIPEDCWHDPYMGRGELKGEIDAGVIFFGWFREDSLLGVMGLQDKGEVALIRHAYVRSSVQRIGIGSRLLKFLEAQTDKPVLIGTWRDATWALRFYQKHGYRLLGRGETGQLLHRYWSISERQVETSVVLTNSPFFP